MSYYSKISYTVSSYTIVLTKTKYFLILPSPFCLLSKKEGLGVILAPAHGLLISIVAGFQSSSRILLSFY